MRVILKTVHKNVIYDRLNKFVYIINDKCNTFYEDQCIYSEGTKRYLTPFVWKMINDDVRNGSTDIKIMYCMYVLAVCTILEYVPK